jgi:hypothetical protein
MARRPGSMRSRRELARDIVASVLVAAGSVVLTLGVRSLYQELGVVKERLGELGSLHADTRLRVLAIDTVQEASDVVAAAGSEARGGPE